MLLNQTGTTDNNYLYTGEQYDSTLDQYYLRARYYNQGIGRFTQQDTYQGSNFDPVTLHKYLYANSDPVNYTDPSGNFGLAQVGSALSIASTLASIATTSYNVFQIATGEKEPSAKEIGITLLIAAAGPVGGKLIKILVSSKSAKKLCENVCNLLQRSKTFGSAIKFRNAKSINFTQNNINKNFRNGGSLDDLIRQLRSGKVKSDSLPPIRIFKKDGKIFSLDNRRLYAAQQAGVKIKTVGATQNEILREAWKFTTKNGGASVKVRGR